MACDLKAAFVNNIAPPNSLKRRGYKYESPEKLIKNKNDAELRIPEFSTLFAGIVETREEVRRKVVSWLYEVTIVSPEFNRDPITAFCLAVELFDKVLLSIEKLNIKFVQLLGIVCLWISEKFHQDHFQVHVNAAAIAALTNNAYSKDQVLL